MFVNKNITPLSTLYNSLILKGLKFNNFLAKNCKPSIYRALEKRVESQVCLSDSDVINSLSNSGDVCQFVQAENYETLQFVVNFLTPSPKYLIKTVVYCTITIFC